MYCAICTSRAMFVYLFDDYRAQSLCSLCGPSRQYAMVTSADTMRAFHRWLETRRHVDAGGANELYVVDCLASEVQPNKK
jgi:hypothetical protein